VASDVLLLIRGSMPVTEVGGIFLSERLLVHSSRIAELILLRVLLFDLL
jgi:hypothetical protein